MKKYTLKSLMQESSSSNDERQMTGERLESIIKYSSEYEVLEEEKGYTLFKYLGIKMALLCDEEHNRMRIISPITNYSTLAPKIKDSIMVSNFQSALDARYGVWEDTLYTAFLHPLSSLNMDDFLSALKQVRNLAKSFGKTYSSAQIEFTRKK